jgi:hypothetical protein
MPIFRPASTAPARTTAKNQFLPLAGRGRGKTGKTVQKAAEIVYSVQ